MRISLTMPFPALRVHIAESLRVHARFTTKLPLVLTMQWTGRRNPQACGVSSWQVRAKHFMCRLHASWTSNANAVLHGEPET